MTPGRTPRLIRVASLALLVTLAAVLAASVAACGQGEPRLRITSPRLGETVTDNAAVYLVVDNGGGDDVLVGASSPVAARSSLHLVEERDGLSMMERVEAIDVPNGVTDMHPGGAHVMLEDLDAPLEAGDEVRIELRFARSGARTVTAEVVPLEDLAEAAAGR